MREKDFEFGLLVLALLTIIWQALIPRLAWAPLAAVLVLLFLANRSGLALVPATGMWLPLGMFLLTGLLGALVTFNRTTGWVQFGRLAASLTLFLAILRLKPGRFGVLPMLANVAAATLAVVLLLDWGADRAGIDFLPALSNLGLDLGDGPAAGAQAPSLNQLGGLIALLLPLSVVDLIAAPRSSEQRRPYLPALLLAISCLGLLASSSRGAWVALAAGLIVGLAAWRSDRQSRILGWLAPIILVAVLGVAAGLWLGGVANGDWAVVLDARLAGQPAAVSRVALARQSLYLFQDVPWTGSGLASFGGWYSRYIRLIPQFYFDYAHNLFLDVLLSQGPLGLLSLAAVLAFAVGAAVRFPRRDTSDSGVVWLRPVVFAGLIVLILHGLIDSPAYQGAGVGLLLLYPALSAKLNPSPAVTTARPEMAADAGGLSPTYRRRRYGWAAAPVMLTILVGVLIGTNGRLRASWITNWTAIRQAQAELTGWPGSGLLQSVHLEIDDSLERSYLTALSLDPANPTALYRLGLVALRQDRFEAAADRLGEALVLAPDHRGIKKALGYALAWQGDLTAAERVLQDIPEAGQELALYADWWRGRGGEFEAAQSQALSELLTSNLTDR